MVGCCPLTEGLRFGFGLGGALVFGDFGVWGELATWLGVGGFAGVDADAGGVDVEAVPSAATADFLGTLAGAGMGVVWTG